MQVVKIFVSRILSLSNLVHPSDNCVSFFFFYWHRLVKLSLLARIMKKKETNLNLLFAKRGFDEEKILEIRSKWNLPKRDSNFDA